MMRMRVVLILLPIVLMAGCSGKLQTNAGAVRTGCEEAVAQGVSAGRASARLVAQTNLNHQAQDLRGYMIKDGTGQFARAGRRLIASRIRWGLG